MTKKTYYAVDIAKFISALLVVCIHTFPLADISENANFVLVSILARLAVPFFFIASSFFFFKKIDFKKDWNHVENLSVLKGYLWRLFKIYGVWTIVYLPYTFLLMKSTGFTTTTLLRFVRDFFLTGSYYHLWFLPALMFSITVIYFLVMKLGTVLTVSLSLLLYVAGSIGNLYPDVIAQFPAIASIYDTYLSIFVTTRNGLFFGMIFIVLGCVIVQKQELLTHNHKISFATVLSIGTYIAECVLLKINGRIESLSSMYLMLVPCIFFIFICLLRVNMKQNKICQTLRVLSLLIYVSHILFSQALLWAMPSINSFLLYVVTIGGSFLLSYLLYHFSLKHPSFKVLY